MRHILSKIERRTMKLVSLGVIIGILICMIILTFYPITDTVQACSKCGSEAWYFKIIN